MIPQYKPWFVDLNLDINRYLEGGGFLTEYEKTAEFSEKIRSIVRADYCSILPNGTLTLYAALASLGVDQNHSVIIPNYTMAASALAPAALGCNLIFADIEPTTLCIDFDDIKKKFQSNTKAVIFVNSGGRYPSYSIHDLKDWLNVRGAFLIEDSAQGLGSFYPCGAHVGTVGDLGSYSFSMPKIITTGQGGALVTNNPELAGFIQRFKDFGRSSAGIDKHETLGLNLKFTDLQAVVGLNQIKTLAQRIKLKKDNFKYLKDNIKNPNVQLLDFDLEYTTPWFYEIKTDNPFKLQNYLSSRQIGSRVVYPELNKQPCFQYLTCNKESLEASSDISKHGLWLPSYPQLTQDNLDYTIASINSYRID
jgi:perosamine synthetase